MKVLHVVIEYETSEDSILGDLKWLLEKSDLTGATTDMFTQIIEPLT